MAIGPTTRRFATVCVTVERPRGARDDGRWVEGAPEVFEIRAGVQPAPRDVVQRLPENHRAQGAVVIFPKSGSRELKLASPSAGVTADRIVIDGERYQLESVERWPRHRRYVATRLGQ